MSGKTTLLHLLIGLLRLPLDAKTGRASISGELSLERTPRPGKALPVDTRRIYLLSHNDPMFPELTIWENVLLARQSNRTVKRKEAHYRFQRFLTRFSVLADVSYRTRLGQLSSGAQAMIRLARAVVWRSDLTLIDELTGHLDDTNAELFFQGAGDLIQDRRSLVLVSHLHRDHELARNLSRRLGAQYQALHIVQQGEISCLTVR